MDNFTKDKKGEEREFNNLSLLVEFKIFRDKKTVRYERASYIILFSLRLICGNKVKSWRRDLFFSAWDSNDG